MPFESQQESALDILQTGVSQVGVACLVVAIITILVLIEFTNIYIGFYSRLMEA